MREFDNNKYGLDFYMDLAWEGLRSTAVWNNLSQSEKNRINGTINSFNSTGEKICQT